MAAPIPLRSDFDAAALRHLARRSRDASQARRLVALAVIYEGAARGDAARLQEVAAAVAPGARAVLVLDQAGWHMTAKLAVPPNITIMPLPKAPELNPVENLWQFIRENWLSNRIFRSYDDILDHACAAWTRIVDQSWRIRTIGRRKWAHGS
jgi:transposase